MIARRQTGAWTWTWTLPPAQQVVKVLSAPKWINCVEFEFFLGQLKMQKSSSTVSGFQPLSPQDDFDAWTESAIIFVWHCFSKRYQFNLLCLYPSRISSLVRIQFCVRNIAQGRPCRAKKKNCLSSDNFLVFRTMQNILANMTELKEVSKLWGYPAKAESVCSRPARADSWLYSKCSKIEEIRWSSWDIKLCQWQSCSLVAATRWLASFKRKNCR